MWLHSDTDRRFYGYDEPRPDEPHLLEPSPALRAGIDAFVDDLISRPNGDLRPKWPRLRDRRRSPQ